MCWFGRKIRTSTFYVDFLVLVVYNKFTFPCSSMVEQEAVNFEVASSSLAGGATNKKECLSGIIFYPLLSGSDKNWRSQFGEQGDE